MWLWVCAAAVGVATVIYTNKEKLKTAIQFAHFEVIYWILGGISLTDDLIFFWKNKVKELPCRTNDTAIVTGGSRGMGLEVVRRLLECDMNVVIGCRKVEAGIAAIQKIREQGISKGTAVVEELDTSSVKSVEKFAKKFKEKNDKLHLLINNAGIMLSPYNLTEDGFETQFGVNYMGHALLVHLLLPLLKETGRSATQKTRIVNVSSCAHIPGSINFEDLNYSRVVYIPSEAYAQSKLALLMFSNALDRQLRKKKVNVASYAVHPGIVDTDLFNGTLLKTIFPWMPALLFKTPEQGSRSIVFTALSETLEEKGGVYISNCREAWTSPRARNIEQQDKLMQKTMELLKIKNFGNLYEEHEN